ncbi:isochorismatase family protein, partial [Streptomyces calidiresistens]|nr:isochorismatase family protein [Streptomyces calidiresistens]
PGPDALPANRVEWTPDPRRAVLLVHDLQNHFLSAFTTDAPPIPEMLRHIGRLRAVCAEAGIPVLYTAQPGGQTPEQRGLQQDFWGPGIPDDPRAAAIADAVAPGPEDTVVTKWKYGAFTRTDLDARLRELGRDELIVTGVYAHIGVQVTACEAWMRDLRAFVVADAVADFSEAEHLGALAWAAGRCAVVTDTESLVRALGGGPGEGNAVPSLPVVERLRADVADLLGEDPADLPVDEDLADHGLDSIRLMSLLERWRAEYGVDLAFPDLAEEPILRRWAELLAPRP